MNYEQGYTVHADYDAGGVVKEISVNMPPGASPDVVAEIVRMLFRAGQVALSTLKNDVADTSRIVVRPQQQDPLNTQIPLEDLWATRTNR